MIELARRAGAPGRSRLGRRRRLAGRVAASAICCGSWTAVSTPHPLALNAVLARDREQRGSFGYILLLPPARRRPSSAARRGRRRAGRGLRHRGRTRTRRGGRRVLRRAGRAHRGAELVPRDVARRDTTGLGAGRRADDLPVGQRGPGLRPRGGRHHRRPRRRAVPVRPARGAPATGCPTRRRTPWPTRSRPGPGCSPD